MTILLEVIRDALYIRYIIQDYTYIFVVFDIISNLLFCIAIGLSFENGEEQWAKISEKLEDIQNIIVQIADVYGDAIIVTKRLQKDGIHPSWEGYKELVKQAR